ncbi:hypothetical protein [Halalkalicoccus subterraneus]|uniref:hypothetical protein n=1 Tax=Halalkalicoccus subterraneus TaxID=2675002 RepID=UPI000EFA84E0|nr:hypothetical protein [Halalkalicoccus subterraneus]
MIDNEALTGGLVIGIIPPFVLSLDGFWDPWLVFFVWVSFTIAGWLLVRRRAVLRGGDRRWNTLFVLLIVGGSQFGIHMNLPIDSDLRIALWFLVMGIGLAAMLIGVEIGRHSVERSSNPDVTAD